MPKSGFYYLRLITLPCSLLGALICALLPCFSAPSQELLHAQQQQQQQQLWRQNSQSSGNHYGQISNNVQRMEDMLANSQQSLNQGEYYDLQSRLYSLKQSALLELSRGADASVLSQPAQSLEQEIAFKIKDLSQHRSARKSQLEFSVAHLESVFRSKKDELIQEDANKFQEQINELKKQSQESRSLDDTLLDRLLREANDLNSKILDKVLFGPKRHSVNAETKEEMPKKIEGQAVINESAEVQADVFKSETDPTASDSKKTLRKGVLKEQKQEYVPISKIIEKIENELMDFHEKHQIGTFDMDSFTGRLLAQKRNLKVMMSRTGRVPLRQEAVLRENLERLHEELINRVTGQE